MWINQSIPFSVYVICGFNDLGSLKTEKPIDYSGKTPKIKEFSKIKDCCQIRFQSLYLNTQFLLYYWMTSLILQEFWMRVVRLRFERRGTFRNLHSATLLLTTLRRRRLLQHLRNLSIYLILPTLHPKRSPSDSEDWEQVTFLLAAALLPVGARFSTGAESSSEPEKYVVVVTTFRCTGIPLDNHNLDRQLICKSPKVS